MKRSRNLAEQLISRYLKEGDAADPSDLMDPNAITQHSSAATPSDEDDDPPTDPSSDEDDDPTQDEDDDIDEDDLELESTRFIDMHLDQIKRGEDTRMLVNSYAASMNLSANDLYAVVTDALGKLGVSYR